MRRLLWLLISVVSLLLLVAFLYSLSKVSPRFHKWLINTKAYRRLNGFMNDEKKKIGMKRLSKSRIRL